MIVSSTVKAQLPAETGESPVVVETNLVNVTVTVTEANGRNVSGLDQNAFSIYDNKQRQEISWFSIDDSPASIAVVFDLSGSMSRQKTAQAQVALQRFFENSHPLDEYSLIAFDGEPRVSVDDTRDPGVIIGKLSFQPAHGLTALYDACRLAVTQVTHSVYRRRAILIISDGQDNNSQSTLSELRRQLQEQDVLVYAIGINDQARLGPAVDMGRRTLVEITKSTGGQAFFPFNENEMIRASEQIALELRSQYQIAYRPTELVSDRKWNQIKVTVKPLEQKRPLRVHHKAGYYSPDGTRLRAKGFTSTFEEQSPRHSSRLRYRS
jgi:Ca-activated chloride channel family protein